MRFHESKTLSKIECLRIAGNINRVAIHVGFDAIRRGVSLTSADAIISEYILDAGGTPAFLGYRGYPNAACISINNQVVHSIPSDRFVQDGDIVTIDLGTTFGDWNVDSAHTEIVGTASKQNTHLVKGGHNILLDGLRFIYAGATFRDMVANMDHIARSYDLNVFPEFGGHRIGHAVHEEPFIPMTSINTFGRNYEYDYIMQEEDILCIEPIVTAGPTTTTLEADGWTRVSPANSVHFEHTIRVTQHGCEVIS